MYGFCTTTGRKTLRTLHGFADKLTQKVEKLPAHCFQVRALVLGSVAGVAEGLVTSRVLTQIRLLPRVATQVDLQILQPRESLLAALKL